MPFQDRSFPALNAVRAAGAIMVVLTHVAFDTGRINDGWTGAVLARFDFGVALFFVLSGFLLSRPWLLSAGLGRPAPSTSHYLWKRAVRILPLYWVVVVLSLTLDPVNSHTRGSDWLANLTLTQLYRPGLLPSSLTQMWSLCTEVAFYVVLPVLCWVLTWRGPGRGHGLRPRTALLRIGVVALAGLAWHVAAARDAVRPDHYSQWLPSYLPWFLVGSAFAVVSASLAVSPREHLLERLGRDLPGCWILATAIFAIACSPLAGPRLLLAPEGWEAGAKTVLYTAAAGLYVLPLVFGPEREGAVRKRLSGRVPTWLGDISYGVFAIHMFVLNAVFRALDLQFFTGRFGTVLALTLGVTVVVATASFYGLERPLMRLKNLRLFARPNTVAGPDAVSGPDAVTTPAAATVR